ncbi:Methyltransferase domain-containing protein [Pseudarcicella hirudinis]|uniref:Methyltransferase domain-containing protein n=1 Tax=Pseudarcicella hirudinis TaxID=1079859 RepID=A0A1I5W925_9BACT|nr:class I SAM-dependent methyltransferase [Pseudarcicella hirudinis]SFQ16225.1 Methyltransferase domain-containing protein [Pseudarcicella hirudinis]
MKKIISWTLRNIPRKYLQLVSHFVMKVYAFFLRGNKVECPVCSSTFTKFVPYGRVVARENALCPNCLALERHRLMYLYLQRKTGFFKENLKVLHVAPEYCFIDRFEKMKNLDYITADIESPLAKVKMDLHNIPFEDNTFDVVFCNHVLEHVEDDIRCMQEMKRVLKPNGWGIMQSPQEWSRATTYEDKSITDPKEREAHFLQDDHVRIFGRDYGQRLQKGGFHVTEDKFVMEMLLAEADRYALPKEEIIYFCEKK